jgi:hypothetical protein
MTPIERFFDIIDGGIRAAISFIDTLVSRLLAAMGQIARGLIRVGAGIMRLGVYITAFASIHFMGLDLKSSTLFWTGVALLVVVPIAFATSFLLTTQPASGGAVTSRPQGQGTPAMIWLFFFAGLFFAVDWYLGTALALWGWTAAAMVFEQGINELLGRSGSQRRR